MLVYPLNVGYNDGWRDQTGTPQPQNQPSLDGSSSASKLLDLWPWCHGPHQAHVDEQKKQSGVLKEIE